MSAAQGIGVGERTQPEVDRHDRRRARAEPARPRPARTPYLLLLPGLAWLASSSSSRSSRCSRRRSRPGPPGAEIGVYTQTFRFANYTDALSEYARSSAGRSSTRCIATVLALAISYPLAYAIAFKAGRWRNLLLVLVVAPFFTSFLLRTIAWKQILADDGLGRRRPALRCTCCRPTDRIINTAPRGGRRPHLQLPAVHDPAALRHPGAGRPAAASRRPATCTPTPSPTFRKVTFPLSMPGVVAGTLLTFIPAAGDYVNAALLGNPRHHDGRQRHRQPVPRGSSTTRPRRCSRSSLMASILVLVALYIRRAGTEELV